MIKKVALRIGKNSARIRKTKAVKDTVDRSEIVEIRKSLDHACASILRLSEFVFGTPQITFLDGRAKEACNSQPATPLPQPATCNSQLPPDHRIASVPESMQRLSHVVARFRDYLSLHHDKYRSVSTLAIPTPAGGRMNMIEVSPLSNCPLTSEINVLTDDLETMLMTLTVFADSVQL